MVAAYVFIQYESGDPEETLNAVRGVDGVKQAHMVLGPTDVIAFVEAANMESLGEIVLKILDIEGTGRTDTRLAWPI